MTGDLFRFGLRTASAKDNYIFQHFRIIAWSGGDVRIVGKRMKASLVKIGYGVLLLGGVTYGYLQLRGPNGISALIDKRQEIHNLENENLQLQREIASKRTRVEELKSDPDKQELEIRKELKLLKPGEKSYIMQDTPQTSVAPAAK
jgi:cell division protein FtsB